MKVGVTPTDYRQLRCRLGSFIGWKDRSIRSGYMVRNQASRKLKGEA